MIRFVADLLCPCGKPQCYVCKGANETDCVRRQQLRICPNVEVRR